MLVLLRGCMILVLVLMTVRNPVDNGLLSPGLIALTVDGFDRFDLESGYEVRECQW